MHVTTYTYDANGDLVGPESPSSPGVRYTYSLGAAAGGHRPAALDVEGLELLALVREAGSLLTRQFERGMRRTAEDPAAWPEVKAATGALLLQLACAFREQLGEAAAPRPDVVVDPPTDPGPDAPR
jgi:hypothetical protein